MIAELRANAASFFANLDRNAVPKIAMIAL
jgi:hypothetical protein